MKHQSYECYAPPRLLLAFVVYCLNDQDTKWLEKEERILRAPPKTVLWIGHDQSVTRTTLSEEAAPQPLYDRRQASRGKW